MDRLSEINQLIASLLEERGLDPNLVHAPSLFSSGYLDSIAAVHVILFLETKFNFRADSGFTIGQIDSVIKIMNCIPA